MYEPMTMRFNTHFNFQILSPKAKRCKFPPPFVTVYINKNYLCDKESRKMNEMEQIDKLKELINQGDVDVAIEQLNQLLEDTSAEKEKDTLYYLRGNAYRKKGDWKRALDNYQLAIDLNPDSPAVQARKMALDILNFYNKDMFNQ